MPEGNSKSNKTAVIIGAGPAGLTAAYELLDKTDITPVVFEATSEIGGISRTVNYKGNRIDIGGHRFFSKSDRVMCFWQDIFPLQGKPARDDIALGRYVPLSDKPDAPDPQETDKVILMRNRISRIFYARRFFDYPITLSRRTISNLGLARMIKIALSYFKARLLPVKKEKSLEHFLINRFGKELYSTFFKDYTQKVWGVPCNEIKPEWGAQRIKGLSVSSAVFQAARNIFAKDTSLEQKKTETTLIRQFMYPKLGPGQFWEELAGIIKSKGGKLYLRNKVTGLKYHNNTVTAAEIKEQDTGRIKTIKGDYYFSTMPVKDLISAMGPSVPAEVREVAAGLVYRDFITVGLLLRELRIKNQTKTKTINNIVPDNWIYVQERDVKIGRLQIFNNWSPYMVKDENNIWIGLEYFCTEGDKLWNKSDDELKNLAINELEKIDIIDKTKVIDSVVIRSPKTYPAYFGSYENFDVIRNFADDFENLFLVGRNGMHRYNNQDHSMLTAMTAVENIAAGIKTKDNIWDVNTELQYHEEK
ncbi:MAG: NAD(P)/FAD-dependent oxidoreductase [Sedimentisphaerales bacterium]|nr:NAD(P)/FAD-dependent oxidoreductase [Sedimentisphaerales bacterium]